MAFESLEAELKLDTSNFERGLATAGSKMDSFAGKVTGAGKRMQGIGKTMSTYVTAPIVGGFGLAINSAIGWEDTMVEIAKVSDKEIAGTMGGAILEMTDTLPIAATELGEIAAAGARLGVPAEHLEGFTETVGTFAAVTDVSADVAGDAFARISTLMGLPIEEADHLGSAINELSNNFGTDAGEMIDVMTRAGGAFNLLGLGADEALGLSAAMNEVSPSSRLAAGGLKRMAEEMMEPGNVEAFAEALGVTPDEFLRMRENDPQGTLLAIAEAAAGGGERFDILYGALGKTATEFATLGTNTDQARSATEQANEQYGEATSLQNELENVTNSTSGQIQLMKNQLFEMSVTIGNLFIPYLQQANAVLTEVINRFLTLNPATQRMIVIFALIAAAIGPVLIILGTMLVALGAIIPVVAGFGAALAGLMSVAGLAAGIMSVLGTAIAILTSPILLVVAAIALLAYAFYTDFGGIRTFTIGVIMSLVTLFTGTLIPMFWQVVGVITQFVTTFIGLLQQLWTFIEPYVMQLVLLWRINMGIITDELNATIQAWIDTFNYLFGFIQPLIHDALWEIRLWWWEHGEQVMEIVNMLFGWLVTFIGAMMQIGVDVTRAMLALLRLDWETFSTAVMNIVQTFVDLIIGAFLWLKERLVGGSIVPDMLNAMLGFFQSILDAIIGVVDAAMQLVFAAIQAWLTKAKAIVLATLGLIRQTFQTVLNAIKGIVTTLFNAYLAVIRTVFNAIKSAVSTALATIRANFQAALNTIRSIVSSVMATIRSNFQAALNTIKSIVSSALAAVRSNFQSALNNAKSIVSSTLATIRSNFQSALNNIKSAVSSGMSNVVTAFRNGIRNALNAITSRISDFKSAGSDLVGALADGISAGIGKVRSAAGDVMDAARSVLPGSDAEEGPLSDLSDTGPAFVETVAEGILQNRRKIPRAMAKAIGEPPMPTGAGMAAAPRRPRQAGGGDPILNKLDRLIRTMESPVEISGGRLRLADGSFVEIVDGRIQRKLEERSRRVDRR